MYSVGFAECFNLYLNNRGFPSQAASIADIVF